MLSLKINDTEYFIDEKILTLSNICNMYHKNTGRISIYELDLLGYCVEDLERSKKLYLPNKLQPFVPFKPFHEIDFVKIGVDFLNKWISSLTFVKKFDETDFIFCDFPFESTDLFKDMSLKSLLLIYNFATSNDIILLTETISKVISTNRILIGFESGEIFIYEVSHSVRPEINAITPNAARNILKYKLCEDNVDITKFPPDILKSFSYNASFNKDFSKYFGDEVLVVDHLTDENDLTKPSIIKNMTYTEFKKFKSAGVIVKNIVLTSGDLGKVVSSDRRTKFMIQNFSDYLEFLKNKDDDTIYINWDDWDIEEIQIFNYITEIGQHAFAGCNVLKTICFPENLTVIDNYAFDRCKNLTDIEFPKGLKKIGDYAFNLTKVEPVDLNCEIGYHSFTPANEI